jgi:uncharacterized membrane protein
MREIGRREDALVEVHAVSANGRLVVGTSWGARNAGFVWSEDTGFRYLRGVPGSVPGDEVYCAAYGMNRSGSIIVGEDGGDGNALMWIGDSIINLGKFVDFRRFNAVAVNDDGTVVAGTSFNGPQNAAFATVWTPGHGIQTLSEYAASYGVYVPMNVILQTCTSVSADGMTFAGVATVVGQEFSSFGYVLTVPNSSSLALFVVGVLGLGRSRRRST